MNSDNFDLTDFYVKFEKKDEAYYFRNFISYDKTQAKSGGFYEAKTDLNRGSFGIGIPQGSLELGNYPTNSKITYEKVTRFLSPSEKIYFEYALENGKEFKKSFDEYLSGKTIWGDKQVILTDFYVKFNNAPKSYRFDIYISFFENFPKTNYRLAQYDKNFGWNGVGIPNEADRGGMNPNFVQYDYITKYNYLKNYPKELLPFIELGKDISAKVDYDFNAAYGLDCKIRTGKQGSVCDGYADYTINRLREANINGITEIYKVSSSKMNHAWVELVFNGKPVYFDATWFDINQIGDDGYSVTLPQDVGQDFDWQYITYDKKLFDNGFSGKAYYHYAGNDAVKTLVWSK
jgi:hypothetical protein